jgi:hypothetical protein
VKTNAKGGADVQLGECDVTYVLKEPRRRSKCVIHKACRIALSKR